MKVAFSYPAFENVGLEYLSAMLKREGHQTRLFFDPVMFDDCYVHSDHLKRWLSYRDHLVRNLVAWQPDLVAIGVVGTYMQWAADLARRVKQVMDVPIVMGGIHVTSVPDEVIALPQVDYAIVGEGEHPIVELAEAVQGRRALADVGNLVWTDPSGQVRHNPLHPLIADLDSLPFPDKDLFYDESPLFKQGYLTATQRGCTNRCPFCHTDIEKRVYGVGNKEFVRRRSVDDVVEEIRQARDRHGIDFVRFGDDTFSQHPRWLDEFAEKYPKGAGVPFWCFVRADTVSPRVVNALKKAGCKEVQAGVQTIREDLRREVLHRRETNEQIRQMIRLFTEAGIAISTDNIINLPDHDIEDLEAMSRFYLDTPPTRLNSYWITYFPELELTERAISMGVLDEREAAAVRRGEHLDALERGGTKFDPTLASMQTFFLLQDFLPRRLSQTMLKHRLNRRLPYLGMMPTFFLQYAASYAGKRMPNDVFFRRMIRQYPTYLWRMARDRQ